MYAVKTKSGLLAKTYTDLEDAKHDAVGFLISRSSEKTAHIVTITPGVPFGGDHKPIWTVTKRRKDGVPVWKQVEPSK